MARLRDLKSSSGKVKSGLPLCPNCGKEVSAELSFCTYCGHALRTSVAAPPQMAVTRPTYPMKNEGIAAVLSLIVIGLGQVYVGRIGRGILIFVLGIVVAVASIILLFIPLIIYWIWNIFDAYRLAKRYNAMLVQHGQPPW